MKLLLKIIIPIILFVLILFMVLSPLFNLVDYCERDNWQGSEWKMSVPGEDIIVRCNKAGETDNLIKAINILRFKFVKAETSGGQN